MSFKSYKEDSKKNWGTNTEGELDRDQIQLGAILRIADAAEAMSQNYVKLQNNKDYYEKLSASRYNEIKRLKRSNAALRGQITKLKRKMG